jgi:TfoX/Sxy family transcriptional regulator of competence genes
VRKRLGKRRGFTEVRRLAEIRVFGGIGFLLDGNMCCGVHGADLLVRVDPAETERLLAEPGTRRFDLSGRPMDGWLLVGPDALVLDAALDSWIQRSLRFAQTLPKKAKK